MNKFTKIKEGSVEIEHFSTASVIKITFKHQEQKNEQSDLEEVLTEHWLDYVQFADLKKAIDLIKY